MKSKKKAESKKYYCPQCNAEVSFYDEFCSECGKLLLLDEDYDAIADEDNE